MRHTDVQYGMNQGVKVLMNIKAHSHAWNLTLIWDDLVGYGLQLADLQSFKVHNHD